MLKLFNKTPGNNNLNRATGNHSYSQGSLYAKAQATVTTGSRHLSTTPYKIILASRGSSGRSAT